MTGRQLNAEVLSWLGLGMSLAAGALLYASFDKPWLAVASAPLVACRIWTSLNLAAIDTSGNLPPAQRILVELSARLGDLAIFLPFAFWPDVKIHLVLLGIVAMLLVSHVGLLGLAINGKRLHTGLISEPLRLVLLVVACLCFGLAPEARIFGFTVFELLLGIFVPLASITLLQRLDKIVGGLSRSQR